MNRIGKLVGLVGLALVAGCAVDPNEQTQQQEEVTGSSEEGLTKGPVVPTDPPTKIGPSTPADSPTFVARSNAPAYQPMSTGDGWRMVNVNGVVNDSDTASPIPANEPVYIVDSIDKIDNAPLQASTKSAIKAKFASKTGDARQGAIFVRKSVEDQIAAQPKTGGVSTFAGCSDTDRTYTKAFDYTKNFTYTNNGEAGHFTGSFGVDGYTRANASASVTVTLDRVDLPILGCTTYWGHLKSASVVGSAIVDANGKANGTFAGAWAKSYSLAEPTVFDDWISIGGIPVWIKITIPIEAGIEANAQVNASVDAHVVASGQFNVTCDSGDCTFDKSASFVFRPNQDAHLGVNVRAKVIPSVTASAKLAIYDSAASAKVGVKAGLVSDFWGYYGNTCGDANGDNIPEYVSAATLDESVQLDLAADIRLFGSSLWNRTFNILTWHVGFYDLLGHSTALDPIVTPKYGSPTVNVRMRPCFPYADPVNYQIDWMDGTAPTAVTSAAAQTNASASHTYAAAGPRIGYRHSVTAKALTDNAAHGGRTLNGSTVGKYDSTPVLVVSQ